MILFIGLFVIAVATNAQAVINDESYVNGYRYNGPAHKYLPPQEKHLGYHHHQQQSYNGPSHQYLPIAMKPLTATTITTTTQAPLTSSSHSSSYSYGEPYNNNYPHQTTQLQSVHVPGVHDNGYVQQQQEQNGDAYHNYGNRYYNDYVSKPIENNYLPPSKTLQQQEHLNNYNKYNYNHNQLGYNYGVPQSSLPSSSSIPSSSSPSSSSLQSTFKPQFNENSAYRYEKPNIGYYPTQTSSSSSSLSSNTQQYNNRGINANNFQSDIISGFSTSWPGATGTHIGQTSSFSIKPNDAASYQNHVGHGKSSSSSPSSSLSDNNIDYLQMQSHSYELPSYFIMQQPPKQTQQQHQQQQGQYHNHDYKSHNYDGVQYNGNGYGNGNIDKYTLGTQYQYHKQDKQQQQQHPNNVYMPPSLEFQPPYY